MRWSCAHCPSVQLCSKCYMADEHDTAHKFRRFDSGDEEDLGQVINPIDTRRNSLRSQNYFRVSIPLI